MTTTEPEVEMYNGNPVIEWHNGKPVTAAALRVNIGSGLKESHRFFPPRVFHEGDVIDICARVKVGQTGHKPLFAIDGEPLFDGEYVRMHNGRPLILVAVEVDTKGHSAVSKLLDQREKEIAAEKAAASKQQEIEGQQALLDEEQRLAAEEANED